MVKKQNTYILLGALALTMFFAACGDSVSTDTPKETDMSVTTMENLPNCTENREGMTALVAEDNSTYECKSGKWTFVSAPMQTVETLDDLSNCTSKAEGDTVRVTSERAIFRCDDGKWEKYRTLMDTLASAEDLLACVAKREGNTSYITKEHALYRCEDGSWEKMVVFMDTIKTKNDLPNCTGKKEGDSTFVSKEESVYLCVDNEWNYLGEAMDNSDDLPNCTEKREGNKAFVTVEHATLICNDGKWLPYDIYKETEEKKLPESSSSSDKSSSSQKDEFSSSSINTLNPDMEYGKMKDSRDGHVYKIVKIGDQVWMAENLNFKTDSSFCYNNEESKCTKYGRLYTWAAAVGKLESECGSNKCSLPSGNIQGVCPSGWHLPSKTEWETLFNAVGGQLTAGWVLKSSFGWDRLGDGSDAFEFSVLPAGGKVNCGEYSYEGQEAHFWSSTEDSYREIGWSFGISFYAKEYANLTGHPKRDGFSVRCLKGEGLEKSGEFPSSEVLKSSSSQKVESSSSINIADPCKTDSTDNCVYGSLTDSRDGQIYKTVTIGSQTWMAENLNFKVDSSFCYNSEENNCTRYGRLYRWAAAVGKLESECGYGYPCYLPSGNIQGVCPSGWHLPSSDEWNALFTAVGGESSAGKVLRSASDDYEGETGYGMDSFGFSALPAGYRYDPGKYYGEGDNVCFWSSTEYAGLRAFGVDLYSSADLDYRLKNHGFSVRCLKD